jgi:hypothetical protein
LFADYYSYRFKCEGFNISSACGTTVVMQGRFAGRNVSQAGRLAARQAPIFEVNLAAGG